LWWLPSAHVLMRETHSGCVSAAWQTHARGSKQAPARNRKLVLLLLLLLSSGDEVISINDQPTEGWTGDMAAKLLRGKGGTEVRMWAFHWRAGLLFGSCITSNGLGGDAACAYTCFACLPASRPPAFLPACRTRMPACLPLRFVSKLLAAPTASQVCLAALSRAWRACPTWRPTVPPSRR
jgi:hypothetical protein